MKSIFLTKISSPSTIFHVANGFSILWWQKSFPVFSPGICTESSFVFVGGVVLIFESRNDGGRNKMHLPTWVGTEHRTYVIRWADGTNGSELYTQHHYVPFNQARYIAKSSNNNHLG
jgi:hypothetical protein